MRSDEASGPADVAIVVPTYNHAHFLPDALDSIMAQTCAAADILVVDDGSTDDAAAIVARYTGVRILRTANQGLAAARNNGLAALSATYVIFLDADDVLTPTAIEHGLACMNDNPGAGFVCGGYRLADTDLRPRGGDVQVRLGPLGHTALLYGNLIGMPATVLYDRQKLIDCGGFDPSLRRCEDYDLYLRMSERFRIASHRNVVAHYRLHGSNMSLDAAEMLVWNRRVLERNRPPASNLPAVLAWNEGMRAQTAAFANLAWTDRGAQGGPKWKQRRRMMAVAPWTTTRAALRQVLVRCLPAPLADVLRGIRRRSLAASTGKVDFGDLARIKPVSEGFGFRRGTPVDRFYIEGFLTRHAGEITGNVLEVADDKYSKQFGRGVIRQDVLNIADDPGTTIVGDLCQEGVLAAATYDCILLTQTMQYLFDIRAAITQLHRALKPGGVVLATVPAISPVDNLEWEWYWLFTQRSARRLFDEAFGAENVEVEVFGNAFAATCFIQGVAQEDVGVQWLEPIDPSFPVSITIRARRPT